MHKTIEGQPGRRTQPPGVSRTSAKNEDFVRIVLGTQTLKNVDMTSSLTVHATPDEKKLSCAVKVELDACNAVMVLVADESAVLRVR